MEDSIPKGWAKTQIVDLCNLINGKAFKPSDWSDTGLPIIRIQNLNNPNARFNYYEGDLPKKFLIKNGDLLFAWSGTPGTSFGTHIWNGAEAVLNQHIFKMVFNEAFINKAFFRYAINQKLEELIGKAHGGVGLRHVTKGKFEKTIIHLPPLPEQKRIADKLDYLLAKVDACQARLNKVPKIIKRFRQSVLADATSGKLTEGWRTDKNLSLDSWLKPKIEELIEFGPQNGLYKPATFYGNNGNRIVRIDNFYSGKLIDWDNTKKLKLELDELEKWELNQDDILINRVNSIEYLGKSNIVSGLPGRCVFESNIMRFSVNKKIIFPKYLVLFLASEVGTSRLRENAKHAINQASINQTDVKNVIVNLPPIEEQKEIVKRVGALFSVADQLEKKLKNAQASVDKLTPSTLAKAFRGELVPQNPNDEPTEMLLKRKN